MGKKNKLKKETEQGKPRKPKIWIYLCLLGVITFGVYYNSLNAPFIFDDIDKIVENSDIRSLNNIKTKLIYPYDKENKKVNRNDPSRPLTYLTFTLNYHFGQLNTFGYHLVNVLLHIFNTILIFFLTREILSYSYKKHQLIVPFIVAVYFGIHPINIDSVTYIFARAGVLATFFYIASLICFIKASQGKKNFYFFPVSLLCFILSLASKQIAVTLPATILFVDYIFLSNFKISKIVERRYYHVIL